PKGGNGHKAGKERPEKHFAERMIGHIEKPERGERADDGAKCVHQALKAKCATVGVWRHVSREQGFPCGGTHAASEPGSGASHQHVVGLRGKSERRGRNRGECVTKHCKRFAMFQSVRVMPGDEFRETRQPVGDAFDRSEPCRARANRREKRGQDRGRGLMAPVAEQTGEPDTEHGAIEPGLFVCGFGHKQAVYRCPSAVKRRGRRPSFLTLFKPAVALWRDSLFPPKVARDGCESRRCPRPTRSKEGVEQSRGAPRTVGATLFRPTGSMR